MCSLSVLNSDELGIEDSVSLLVVVHEGKGEHAEEKNEHENDGDPDHDFSCCNVRLN